MAGSPIFDLADHERAKFTDDPSYRERFKAILDSGPTLEEAIHHGNAFNGAVNIARTLAFYELYKMTAGIAGHVAEIGVWKGASFLLWAKLVQIFEPWSSTQVHGFDWFKGMDPDMRDGDIRSGSYSADYQRLRRLIDIQNLSPIARLHCMDVTTDLHAFADQVPDIRFKLVFFDAGVYSVVKSALPWFWEHLTPGGIVVFDQFNYQVSPGETRAVTEILPGVPIRTMPWTRSPSGYAVKGS